MSASRAFHTWRSHASPPFSVRMCSSKPTSSSAVSGAKRDAVSPKSGGEARTTTKKSFTSRRVVARHSRPEGSKEYSQSVASVERSVSDGHSSVSTRSEVRNLTHTEVSEAKDDGTRETRRRSLSKQKDRIAIKHSDQEEVEEHSTNDFRETTETEVLDDEGNVVRRFTSSDSDAASGDGDSSGGVSGAGSGGAAASGGSGEGSGKSKGKGGKVHKKSGAQGSAPRRSKAYEAEAAVEFDIFTVGNPTPEEVQWRRRQLTPHALVIHPDRLLPTIVPRAEEKKGFRRRMTDAWRRVSTSFKRKVVGEERWETITETVQSTYEEASEAWDTTQNPHVVALRSLMDRLAVQTESSKAAEILQTEMEDFWVEDFVDEFSEKMLPTLVRAYLGEDLSYLNRICVGEARVFCGNMIEARVKSGQLLSTDVLWISPAELVETKLGEFNTPQIMLRAEVQTVDCVYDRNTHKVLEGSESLIANNIFVMTLQPNLDDAYVSDLGHPWQVRQFQTQKFKQLV